MGNPDERVQITHTHLKTFSQFTFVLDIDFPSTIRQTHKNTHKHL